MTDLVEEEISGRSYESRQAVELNKRDIGTKLRQIRDKSESLSDARNRYEQFLNETISWGLHDKSRIGVFLTYFLRDTMGIVLARRFVMRVARTENIRDSLVYALCAEKEWSKKRKTIFEINLYL